VRSILRYGFLKLRGWLTSGDSHGWPRPSISPFWQSLHKNIHSTLNKISKIRIFLWHLPNSIVCHPNNSNHSKGSPCWSGALVFLRWPTFCPDTVSADTPIYIWYQKMSKHFNLAKSLPDKAIFVDLYQGHTMWRLCDTSADEPVAYSPPDQAKCIDLCLGCKIDIPYATSAEINGYIRLLQIVFAIMILPNCLPFRLYLKIYA